MPKPAGTGLFVDPRCGLGFAMSQGTVMIGLDPGEMRALAGDLQKAADQMEAVASAVTDAAFERAAGRLQ